MQTSIALRSSSLVLAALASLLGLGACASPPSSTGEQLRDGGSGGGALRFFQGLNGSWSGYTESESGEADETGVALEYRWVAGGTAVEERLFADSPNEMVTMYHEGEDSDEIVVTHYCLLGNQPRLQLKSASEDVLVFEFLDGTGFDRLRDDYMGALTITKVGDDRFTQDWTCYQGSHSHRTQRFVFDRVR